MAKGDDIEERLINFAVAIIALCDKLPDTTGGRHVGGQLLRSGTSPAPNYSEARSAESKRDFVHKLRIALKEMNESRVWLKIIIRSKRNTCILYTIDRIINILWLLLYVSLSYFTWFSLYKRCVIVSCIRTKCPSMLEFTPYI